MGSFDHQQSRARNRVLMTERNLGYRVQQRAGKDQSISVDESLQRCEVCVKGIFDPEESRTPALIRDAWP
jgi:hypothetical protein